MHSIGCSLCFLLAVPGLAQFQTPVPGKLSDLVNPQPGDPVFILYSDLPSPLADIVAGYANINRAGRRASMAHRFFYDRGAHIFFGYDIVVQPQDRIDMYSVGFFNLSMGPLDFPIDSTDSLNPTLWKQVPLPTLLPSQVVRAGEPMSITVYRDPKTGAELRDTMTIAAMPQSVSPVPHQQLNGIEVWEWAHSTPRNGNAAPSHRSYAIFGAGTTVLHRRCPNAPRDGPLGGQWQIAVRHRRSACRNWRTRLVRCAGPRALYSLTHSASRFGF